MALVAFVVDREQLPFEVVCESDESDNTAIGIAADAYLVKAAPNELRHSPVRAHHLRDVTLAIVYRSTPPVGSWTASRSPRSE